MLGLFRLSVFSILVLSGFLGKTAFGSYPPEKNQNPNVAEFERDVPVCYMQTSNHITLDLSSLCNQTPKDPKVNATRTPYNFTAIKKFNDEVYGEDN